MNFNFFVILGLVGQIFFSMRFLVQWIASEKEKESVLPFSFWVYSILGSSFLLIYAIYRKDPIFILGQLPNLFIYTRNVYLIKRKEKQQ